MAPKETKQVSLLGEFQGFGVTKALSQVTTYQGGGNQNQASKDDPDRL